MPFSSILFIGFHVFSLSTSMSFWSPQRVKVTITRVGMDAVMVVDVVQEEVMVAMQLLTFQLHQLKILGNSLLWVSSENFQYCADIFMYYLLSILVHCFEAGKRTMVIGFPVWAIFFYNVLKCKFRLFLCAPLILL